MNSINQSENKLCAKEVKVRIKINKLLEESGWRFLDHAAGKSNIVLEPKTTINALGEDFEESSNGFIDFSLVVLKAHLEDKNPRYRIEDARDFLTKIGIQP